MAAWEPAKEDLPGTVDRCSLAWGDWWAKQLNHANHSDSGAWCMQEARASPTPAVTPTPSNKPPTWIPNRDLRIGLKCPDPDVSKLQAFLIRMNAGESAQELAGALNSNGAKGCFGRKTKAALAEYQRIAGITPASGNFGPITRTKLKSLPMGLRPIHETKPTPGQPQ
jgi:peptidoglycan hydrolase-like protein with peptidoglycan-binding domain